MTTPSATSGRARRRTLGLARANAVLCCATGSRCSTPWSCRCCRSACCSPATLGDAAAAPRRDHHAAARRALPRLLQPAVAVRDPPRRARAQAAAHRGDPRPRDASSRSPCPGWWSRGAGRRAHRAGRRRPRASRAASTRCSTLVAVVAGHRAVRRPGLLDRRVDPQRRGGPDDQHAGDPAGRRRARSPSPARTRPPRPRPHPGRRDRPSSSGSAGSASSGRRRRAVADLAATWAAAGQPLLVLGVWTALALVAGRPLDAVGAAVLSTTAGSGGRDPLGAATGWWRDLVGTRPGRAGRPLHAPVALRVRSG